MKFLACGDFLQLNGIKKQRWTGSVLYCALAPNMIFVLSGVGKNDRKEKRSCCLYILNSNGYMYIIPN